MKTSKTLYVTNRNDWRAWLEENHATEKEIWLVYYKKHTGQPRIPYDDAVEEALCFGWIDSIVRRIDDEKYAQKFTPRAEKSNWSELNLRRIRKLVREDKMTQAGMAKVPFAVTDASEESTSRPIRRELQIPEMIKQTLMANQRAWENFLKLTPSYQKNYVGWITSAKKEETRQKRLREAIEVLAQGMKHGLR